VFIDADKANIPAYFEASLGLSRIGSVIVVDNVVREGKVMNADSADADIRGVRRLAEQLAGDARVSATVVQTVGSKGYDGFLIARVVALA
jgi:predicted O-methyltransferase YrrM